MPLFHTSILILVLTLGFGCKSSTDKKDNNTPSQVFQKDTIKTDKDPSSKEQTVDASVKALPGQFEAIFTDPNNGVLWGKVLPDTYSNGDDSCDNKDLGESRDTWKDPIKCMQSLWRVLSPSNGWDIVKVGGFADVSDNSSDAATACKAIGARLPTKKEYESLILNFHHTYSESSEPRYPIQTETGINEMRNTFPDYDRHTGYWTSSLYYWYSLTHLFGYGAIGPHGRTNKFAVRCVVGELLPDAPQLPPEPKPELKKWLCVAKGPARDYNADIVENARSTSKEEAITNVLNQCSRKSDYCYLSACY